MPTQASSPGQFSGDLSTMATKPNSRYAKKRWWRDVHDEKSWAIFEDFRVFLALVWSVLGLPPPTPIQYDIALYLQHGPQRSIIQAFRGVGKSWITSAFVVWLLLRDPMLKILVISASKKRADNFSTFTLRLIREIPVLAHLAPGRDQRCSMVHFDVGPAGVDHQPSVTSMGITSQLTGSRADIIVLDDVEVKQNSATQVMREKLDSDVREVEAILKPLPEARVILLGTPQTEESIYAALRERGYQTRVWPARYPTPEQMPSYDGVLAPKLLLELENNAELVGHPTDPLRFNDEELSIREVGYGRSEFQLQFMLNTSLSDQDRYPLKLSDLIIHSVDTDVGPEKIIWASSPELIRKELPNVGFNGDRLYGPMGFARDDLGNIRMKPWQGSVLVIDPSGRGKDETGIAVVKMLNSQLFVPVCLGIKGDGYSDETMLKIVKIAKEQKVNLVLIESNFGDGMFAALLKPWLVKFYPVTIEEVRHSTRKEDRIIDVLEPVMNQHRLVIDPKVVQHDYDSTKDLPPEEQQRYRLLYQLTRITRERGSLIQDDRLDALAMGVAYWVEQMSLDIDSAIRDADMESEQRRYERFMELARGQWGEKFGPTEQSLLSLV